MTEEVERTLPSDLNSLTKAQLIEHLIEINIQTDNLKDIVEEKDREIEDSQLKIAKMGAHSAGYLITTPNPLFKDKVHGIQFIKGQAFIPIHSEVKSFVTEPMKFSSIKKYTTVEQQEIRKREKLPTATIAAQTLENDFGYEVKYYNEAQQDLLNKEVNIRAKEYARTLETLEEQGTSQKLVKPGFRGE